jgi:hypothetical protein
MGSTRRISTQAPGFAGEHGSRAGGSSGRAHGGWRTALNRQERVVVRLGRIIGLSAPSRRSVQADGPVDPPINSRENHDDGGRPIDHSGFVHISMSK